MAVYGSYREGRFTLVDQPYEDFVNDRQPADAVEPDLVVAPVIPSAAQDLLDSFNAPDGPPPDWFTQPASQPEPIANLADQIAPTLYDGPQVSSFLPEAPAPANITIAPSNVTNNIFNQVVNYLFGTGAADPKPIVPGLDLSSGSTAGLGNYQDSTAPATAGGYLSELFNPGGARVQIPTSNTTGATGNEPSASTRIDAQLGRVVTPLDKSIGQTPDRARGDPSGLPAQIAATIRGLNIPGVSGIKSDWGAIVALLSVPVALMAILWLARRLYRA